MITDTYPYNKTSVRLGHAKQTEAQLDSLLTSYFGIEAVTVSSARAGIYIILKELGLGRTDHILIPDYLCRSVLYILNLQGFAVQQPDDRTKAAFVFHQWGYPQKMDIVMAEAKKRGLKIIEDCAHTFGSTYKGRMVGSFGDVAVVSFPKFFPTYVGGAVLSANPQMIARARVVREESRSFPQRIFDVLSVRAGWQNYLLRKPPFILHAIYIKSFHFPRTAPTVLRRFPHSAQELKAGIEKRVRIFKQIKEKAGETYHPRHLDEDSEVVPLSVPIFFPPEKLEKAQAMLKERNIKADILHFDVNRNIFDPKYVKCLALPCHQELTDKEVAYMLEVIKTA